MAIEFNGKGKLNDLRIGKELANAKDTVKEEKAAEQKPIIDNKFVKEVGEELLTANLANAYGVKINKNAGEKIDKDFWGDALKGLKLKDTALSTETTKVIGEIDNTFAMIDMENKMKKSPFMQALNKEFGV